jgi:DNA-directed RNA polymerase specialized sigma24 family protein
VLEWKYLESSSVRDIAERLGKTEKAVEAALYRARISFRSAYARRQTQAEP